MRPSRKRILTPHTLPRHHPLAEQTSPFGRRLLATFYQIATKVSAVYDVSLPPDVNAVLESISNWITFGFSGVATTPLECLGLGGYFYKLIFWMILPAGIVIMVVIAVVLSSAFLKRSKTRKEQKEKSRKKGSSHGAAFHLQDATTEPERESTLLEKTLPAVLTALFFLYPQVTKTAFDAFPCYDFEDGRGWLRADVSIEC